MRAKSLYDASPNLIQELAVSAYGYWLRRTRYGRDFERSLARLLQNDHLVPAQADDLRTTLLRRTLERAQASVPFYRTHLAGVVSGRVTLCNLHEQVPLLEKSTVRAQAESLVSEDSTKGAQTISTSGTSGTPLKVRTNVAAIRTNYLHFARFLSWHGVSPFDRGATFAGRLIVPDRQPRPPYWRVNRAMNNLLMSSYRINPETALAYMEALNHWDPIWIDAYPSSLYSLVTYARAAGIEASFRPKVIVTSSETLLETQRAAIELYFGCRVRDQYGSAEMCLFVAECEAGSRHVFTDYGHLEIVDQEGCPSEPGALGRVVATGFINPRMPFIRYLIGDTAIARDPSETCSCGRSLSVVGEVVGRTDDVLIAPDGTRIGRLDPVFKGSVDILEAQIIQVSESHVTLRFVPNEGANPDLIRRDLECELALRLPRNMTCNAEPVDAIAREPNGKFRAVVGFSPNSSRKCAEVTTPSAIQPTAE